MTVFMLSIQLFWFGAVAVADRTAISPVQLGARSQAQSAMALPMRLKSVWLTNTSYAPAAGLESYPTTLMPAAMAALSAGATASGSLAEIAIAFTPCVVASWMKVACASAALLGPTWVTEPPSSAAALSAPSFAASKYGLLICLGMNVTAVPPPAAALDDAATDGAATDGAAAEGAAADGAAAVGAAVDPVLPHAANTIADAPRRAASRPVRCENNAVPPLVMYR